MLLRRGAAARGLDEHRAADAAQFAPPPGFFLPLCKTCPVGMLERIVQIPGRIAAVVSGSHRRLIGEGVHRDEIAPADLDAVYAGLARRSEERRVGKECRSRWS